MLTNDDVCFELTDPGHNFEVVGLNLANVKVLSYHVVFHSHYQLTHTLIPQVSLKYCLKGL